MDNLNIYNQARNVPIEAQKTIGAGRLRGFTDINPMYRIKRLTEMFGPCGIGWWYTVDKQWLETAPNGEIKAFCNITLYYGDPDTGEVSKGIFGTGGSSFLSKEKTGDYVSDECYKMALTDALSVAAKALGVGADVYYAKDRTKYDVDSAPKTANRTTKAVDILEKNTPKNEKPEAEIPTDQPKEPPYVDQKRLEDLIRVAELYGYSAEKMTAGVKKRFGKTPFELTVAEYKTVYNGFLGYKTEQEGV